LRRANLPPSPVLARHLDDASELDRLCGENRAYQSDDNLLKVAASVNENYLRIVEAILLTRLLAVFRQIGPWERPQMLRQPLVCPSSCNRWPAFGPGQATAEQEAES